VNRIEIKKLLLDLDLTVTEIAAHAGGISRIAVWKYFDGKLKNPERRAAIQGCLSERGQARGVFVPVFWPELAAA